MQQETVFERMAVGTRYHSVRQVMEGMLESFAELTGDDNPLHREKEMAREYGYEGRVAHGALIGALLTGMISKVFMGQAFLCLSQKMRYPHCAYVNDWITLELRVLHKSEAMRTIVLETQALNQHGAMVLSGEVSVKLLA